MRSAIQMMLWPPFLPLNIPTDPASIYKGQGWAGFRARSPGCICHQRPCAIPRADPIADKLFAVC